jgi:hypothetical protein
MKFCIFFTKANLMTAVTLAAAVFGLGCAQAPSETANQGMKPVSTTGEQISTGQVTNRILARLDELSGPDDPRLQVLRDRLMQQGMTLVAMGVNPSTTDITQKITSSHTAFIVVAFDLSKANIASAMSVMRGLERFTYVEADQVLQSR